MIYDSKRRFQVRESEVYVMGVNDKRNLDSIPVGALRMIPLSGCMELGKKVDEYLVGWRGERESEHKDSLAFQGYQRESYMYSLQYP